MRDCVELGTDRCGARWQRPPAGQRQPASAAAPAAAIRRQLPPPVVAAGLKSLPLNKAKLLKERLQETTTGTKDPRTGQDLSKNANPGIGLPGGRDLSKEFPSGEKQWNDRIKGSLGGGSDYLGEGTPFDDKPGSNPVDDFLDQHGGNIPDPLAAHGKNRSGFSPAEDQGTTSIICASDYIPRKTSEKQGTSASSSSMTARTTSRRKPTGKWRLTSGTNGCQKGTTASSTRAKADIPAGAAIVPMT